MLYSVSVYCSGLNEETLVYFDSDTVPHEYNIFNNNNYNMYHIIGTNNIIINSV